MSSTATDTLAKKDKPGTVISGGHLVAKALQAEGVDNIFLAPQAWRAAARDQD